MHSVALDTCFSEPTTKICMKIDPYYQRQKCSPGILVSSKISFMQIFAGVRWIWQLMGWRLPLSNKTVRKFAELPIYCQRQKCTPGNVSFWQYKAYADIRGASLERGRQMRVGWSKMEIFASFASYIFRTFTSKATIIILYYVAR